MIVPFLLEGFSQGSWRFSELGPGLVFLLFSFSEVSLRENTDREIFVIWLLLALLALVLVGVAALLFLMRP